jgi:hypothetical protein
MGIASCGERSHSGNGKSKPLREQCDHARRARARRHLSRRRDRPRPGGRNRARGLFTLDSNKAEKAVNWGIAAVVWFMLGRLVARVPLRR